MVGMGTLVVVGKVGGGTEVGCDQVGAGGKDVGGLPGIVLVTIGGRGMVGKGPGYCGGVGTGGGFGAGNVGKMGNPGGGQIGGVGVPVGVGLGVPLALSRNLLKAR